MNKIYRALRTSIQHTRDEIEKHVNDDYVKGIIMNAIYDAFHSSIHEFNDALEEMKEIKKINM